MVAETNGPRERERNGHVMDRASGSWLGPRQTSVIVRSVVNAYMDRLLRGRGHGSELDQRRDVEAECGWPKNPTAQSFVSLCRSNGYAAKAASILPDWTWAVPPEVYEAEDEATTTPFEAALRQIDSQLGMGSKLTQPCAGSLAWPWLCKADRLANLGRYSCLLIGTDDGADLSSEPTPRKGAKLTYLRAFSECDATISELDRDPFSPRYNEPTAYEITLRSIDDPEGAGESATVHWRRILHFTSDTGPVYSDYFLGPILPYLLDLRKMQGADAEGYWKWAFPLFVFETPPDEGGQYEIDEPGLRDVMEKVYQGLQRDIIARGAQARAISPELAEPAAHVLIQLQPICAYLGCPVRKFLGSEEGKLASDQDSRGWHGVGRDRRNNLATPRRVAPLIDRLIYLGVLPEPEQYTVHWPDTEVQTRQEKADTAMKNTQALAAYANSMAPLFVSPMQYLTQWQGFTGAEAQAMIDSAPQWMKANPLFASAMTPPTRSPQAQMDRASGSVNGAAGEGRE